MSKIRINELARQLEVKSREVIEKLQEFGIAEKVTHSSSIDDDMAERLRRYYSGDGASERRASAGNGARADHEDEDAVSVAEPASRPAESVRASVPSAGAPWVSSASWSGCAPLAALPFRSEAPSPE